MTAGQVAGAALTLAVLLRNAWGVGRFMVRLYAAIVRGLVRGGRWVVRRVSGRDERKAVSGRDC